MYYICIYIPICVKMIEQEFSSAVFDVWKFLSFCLRVFKVQILARR